MKPVRYNKYRTCSYSLVAKRSNGNAEIQVRFLVGAPLHHQTPFSVFFFFYGIIKSNGGII